jgi:UDP-glucose 4-epimerase
MKVLVTGGAGFIGSHLVRHFQGIAEVRVLDNLRTGKRENLRGLEACFSEGSILDRERVRECVDGVDLIFHLAALVSVPESVADPVRCRELNVQGLEVVLEEAAAAGVRKLVLSSSAAVYGDDPEVPKREDMVPMPKSPYAESKLAGEALCQAYTEAGKLETTSLRYFNVFGPRQDMESAYAAAVPIFIQQARANQPITIYGDGEQTRDFVYVKDVVSANAFAASERGLSGVYNVGYGTRLSILDLVKMVLELTGSSSEIVHAEERAGDLKHSMAAVDKILAAGWHPGSSLASGMRDMLADMESKDRRAP